MARLDISQPYESFLQSQVQKGLYRSITAAAEAAIKKEMDEQENRRIASVMAEVQKGIDDIEAGRYKMFSKELLNDIALKGRKKAENRLSNA